MVNHMSSNKKHSGRNAPAGKSTAKNSTRKPAKSGEGFVLFVGDQGEGAARIIVIVLKIIMLIITTICALVFGVLGPIVVWTSDFDPSISENPAVLTWLITSCIYIIGTFIIMMGHSRIAAVTDIIAAVGSLVTYFLFVTGSADPDISVGPTTLYMPCLSLTVLAVVIAMLINIPKWLDKKAAQAKEKAPSIIQEEDD